jgi:uncharacterized protein YndB with AHSA1/START domain
VTFADRYGPWAVVAGDPPGAWRMSASNLIELEFRDAGDGTTLVVLTNRGLPDEEAKRAHREGWQASLDNLERVVRE